MKPVFLASLRDASSFCRAVPEIGAALRYADFRISSNLRLPSDNPSGCGSLLRCAAHEKPGPLLPGDRGGRAHGGGGVAAGPLDATKKRTRHARGVVKG